MLYNEKPICVLPNFAKHNCNLMASDNCKILEYTHLFIHSVMYTIWGSNVNLMDTFDFKFFEWGISWCLLLMSHFPLNECKVVLKSFYRTITLILKEECSGSMECESIIFIIN